MLPAVQISKREHVSRRTSFLLVVLSVALGFVIGGLFFALVGVNPIDAYAKILVGSFGSLSGWREIGRKFIPLLLCGAGLAVAFRALFWNIGAEGQMLMGAVGATWVALSFRDAPALVLLPTMFGIGLAMGAAWCILPAILRSRLNVNEVITTLMLNYVAMELVTYLIDGPWKGKTQYGYPYTDQFGRGAWLPVIPGTRVHYPTLIIAVACAVALFYFMERTRSGYEIKVTGQSIGAARYAGISYTKTLVTVALISGGLAGIAGVGEVAGVHHLLSYPEYISAGYGFTAIIVAWVGRLHPVGVVASAIFISGLLVGGDAMRLRVPASSVNIFTGLILLILVSLEIMRSYRITVKWRESAGRG